MVEQLVPILKVADTARSAEWYARLGFVKEFEHRYSDEFPGYAGIKKGDIEIHLSEHPGDATPDTLIYYWVDDVDLVAKEFGAELIEQSWGHEVHLTDPDGNRVRCATRNEA